MKKLMFILLVFANTISAQEFKMNFKNLELIQNEPKFTTIDNLPDSTITSFEHDKNYYEFRHDYFKRKGNKLLITGSTLILLSWTAGIIMSKDSKAAGDYSLGAVLVAISGSLIGIVIDLVAIPYFISAHHNKKLAAQIP